MFSHSRRAHPTHDAEGPPRTLGRILHTAHGYDFVAWLFLGGRERAFRQKVLDLARLTPTDSLLDVGCGTGTLAILAKQQLAPSARVCGIDASSAMIETATRKAREAGVDVAFEDAVVEALPFADGAFDVVTSTLMLHHLPRAVREQCAREMRRVAKPGGRVVAVDFGGDRAKRSFLDRIHRHGRLPLAEITRVLGDAGFAIEENGLLGIHDLQFVVARAP
jgi:ubiquinone/menaquinone biosynthesis C-methylase UbiE